MPIPGRGSASTQAPVVPYRAKCAACKNTGRKKGREERMRVQFSGHLQPPENRGFALREIGV